MKLTISKDGYKISLSMDKDMDKNFLEVALVEMHKALEKLTNTSKAPIEVLPETPVKIQPKHEEFAIRERIPNNIVDVKNLDIKQAVTEKALVRCPNCGQCHCLAINSGSRVYMMVRDFVKDDFNIIAEFDSLTSNGFTGMCCKPDTDKKAYFDDLQHLSVISYEDFAANNDTEVFCPVCCKSETFYSWKNAFEHPLDYFETEQLCNACGGEVITKVVKNQKINKCEICAHETIYKEE